MMRLLPAIVTAILVAAGAAGANAETVIVKTQAALSAVIAAGSGAYVRMGAKYYEAGLCGHDVCLVPGRPELPRNAPAGALPDGKIGTARAGDIRQAWYSKPVARYDHGILGDRIEGGSLVAVDSSGKRFEFILEKSYVFEDIAPRIADLDGDGSNEIVTIRSSLTKGSAVAIYGQRKGKLELLDHSSEIGRAHRWLNIAAIAPLFGSSGQVIAWVETPHIGGTLHVARFKGGKLFEIRSPQPGFSNHFIGSRELGMSAIADFDGDGNLDLFVPSADRRSLRLVTKSGTRDFALPGIASTALAPFKGGVLAGTSDGKLVLVRP
jgi:hypothetical protein